MHNTNANTDLSSCNGTSAVFGQQKACPNCNDNEGMWPVTNPSVSPSQIMHAFFVSLEQAYEAFDALFTYTSDDVVVFRQLPLAFSQWTPSPLFVDLVEYNCAEQFMMASKACIFGEDLALSVILATDDH